MIDREIAKRNLAVNLWEILHNHEEGRGEYKWLAEKMSERLGETIHVSRIQKLLQQTASPEWSFVLNLAELLRVDIEELAKNPTKSAVKLYEKRFPNFCRIVA